MKFNELDKSKTYIDDDSPDVQATWRFVDSNWEYRERGSNIYYPSPEPFDRNLNFTEIKEESPTIRDGFVTEKASDTQVSGSHYKDYTIQPYEFFHKNKVPHGEACAIKYLLRHRDKNGIKDLEKAKHYIDLIIEMEYGD